MHAKFEVARIIYYIFKIFFKKNFFFPNKDNI